MSFYLDIYELPKLTRRQKLRIAVYGNVYVGDRQPLGFSSPVPVYVVKCGKHGLYLDAPHGYSEHFCCRACLAELQIKKSRRVHV